MPEDVAASALRESLAARALPTAQKYFAPDAIAEASVSLTLRGQRVMGRIDRLCVTDREASFVDFKSDAAPPPADAPPLAYLTQLAVYRAALQRIYPDKIIVAEILWTAAPRLDRIENTLLDNALAE